MNERIDAFAQLGRLFTQFGENAAWPGHTSGLGEGEFKEFDDMIVRARHYNGWFTEENVRFALKSLGRLLDREALERWLAAYPDLLERSATTSQHPAIRTIGIIMAGNMPLVGFHDLLCVLLSGNKARLKWSSEDAGLTPAVVAMLGHIAPDLAAQAGSAEQKLGDVDAVIATGSNNTARYFDHYFRHVPRIVRKSRTSIALLDGTETDEELIALGEDVFRYFGLGCRNVGKLYIPRRFDLDRVFKALFPWQGIAQHNKYANNYDYHKAIWLMDRVPLIENGFLLLKEDAALNSPVGSLYYERHDDRSALDATIAAQAGQIQCIVGHGHIPFGQAQCPGPGEYADGVDTMKFLAGLR